MIEQKLALVMFDKFISTSARTKSFTELVNIQKPNKSIQAKKTLLKHQESSESLESYHDGDSDQGLQHVLLNL